jgi:geranylgeranyl pyrophosphate synthase
VHLGVAFQIADDIVDTTITSSPSLKDSMLDAKNNKPNYVSLYSEAAAKRACLHRVSLAREALSKVNISNRGIEQLLDQVVTKISTDSVNP